MKKIHLSQDFITKSLCISRSGLKKMISILKDEKHLEIIEDYLFNKDGSKSTKKGIWYLTNL